MRELAAAMLSINAFKGVEFGIGFEAANHGSEVMMKFHGTKKMAIIVKQIV